MKPPSQRHASVSFPNSFQTVASPLQASYISTNCLNSERWPSGRCTYELAICARSGVPSLRLPKRSERSAYAANPPGVREARVSFSEAQTGVRRVCMWAGSAVTGRSPQQTTRHQAAGHHGRGRKLSEPMSNLDQDDGDRTSFSQNGHPSGDGSPSDESSYPLRKMRTGDGPLEASEEDFSDAPIDGGVVPKEWWRDQLDENSRLQSEKEDLEAEVEDLRDEIQRLEDATGQTAPREFESFPVEALPSVPEAYVEAASSALDVHPAFVAVPLLSVLSSGVGAAARLQLKRSWEEPATLWTAIVAPSGSTKSPALRHALRPVYRHEREALEKYEAAMDRYDPDSDEQKPVRKRYRTGDPTPEAVVQILKDNPRGLLLSRDELAAWIGSFDRYSSGAADLQFWIELWNGVQVSRDRVGDGNVTVSNPAVPLTGTIQPETLKEKIGELHFQSGFASRLILCRPPVKPKTWTEADVTQDLEDRYGRLLCTLYALEEKMETGDPFHVGLSSGAKEKWVPFFNQINERRHRDVRSNDRAARAKTVNHAARLALIFHLCQVAEGDCEAGDVDASTLQDGVTVARWCLSETLRVYQSLDLGTAALEPRDQMLEMLGETFGTADAHSLAPEFDVTERTIRNWMAELIQEDKVEKLHKGSYRKKAS